MSLKLAVKNVFSRPFDRALHGRKNLVGVEVGVFEGSHARALLRNGIKNLYLVDPYLKYSEVWKDLHGVQARAHRKLRAHEARVRWIELKSVEAAGTIVTPLDFVYIDAEHSYEAAREDIAAWWPKIKPGGILGGHDFHHSWPGVVRAVIEFAAFERLPLCVEIFDWWIVKE